MDSRKLVVYSLISQGLPSSPLEPLAFQLIGVIILEFLLQSRFSFDSVLEVVLGQISFPLFEESHLELILNRSWVHLERVLVGDRKFEDLI